MPKNIKEVERHGLTLDDKDAWPFMLKRATREELFKMIEECRHELNSMGAPKK